tara:strand:+ start:460 stop:738 length:279 start_codon:yes stop_codon:yes gene_type:complete
MEEYIRNTYKVLTFKESIETILENDEKAIFFGNPFELTNEDINEMIKFFEDVQEYEKCGELESVIEVRAWAELDMFLEDLDIKKGPNFYKRV